MGQLKAYTDGGFRKKYGAVCAFVVFDGEKRIVAKGRHLGAVTNNIAEYQGLLDALMWAYENEVHGVHFYSDSEVVTKQVDGTYSVNKPHLLDPCLRVRALLYQGGHFLKWIRGHDGDPGNEAADAMVNEIFSEVENETRKA
jgi:ribonuclease HI